MLETGGASLGDVVGAAEANTDENGLVEFAAPKALYLDTQDANEALLRGSASDPLTALGALVRGSPSPDQLRLELVRRWVRSDEIRRAEGAAAWISDPVVKSDADRLLESTR